MGKAIKKKLIEMEKEHYELFGKHCRALIVHCCLENDFKKVFNEFDMNCDFQRYFMYSLIHEIEYISKSRFPNFHFWIPENELLCPPDIKEAKFKYPSGRTSGILGRVFSDGLNIDGEKFFECSFFEFNKENGIITYRDEDDFFNFALVYYKGEFKNPETRDFELKPTTITNKIKLERGNKCEKCGWKKSNCDVHHIIPKKDGGTNDEDNLIVLCPNCHRVEHDKLRGRFRFFLNEDEEKKIRDFLAGEFDYGKK